MKRLPLLALTAALTLSACSPTGGGTTPPPEPAAPAYWVPEVNAPVGTGTGFSKVRVSPNAWDLRVLELTNELRTKGTLNGKTTVPRGDLLEGTCADPVTGGDTAWVPGKLGLLTYDGDAAYAMDKHLQYLKVNGYYNYRHDEVHNGPLFYGAGPKERLVRSIQENSGAAWYYMQENIAFGEDTPERVVQDWLESPGHCAGMMNPKFNAMGPRSVVWFDTTFNQNMELWGQLFVQR